MFSMKMYCETTKTTKFVVYCDNKSYKVVRMKGPNPFAAVETGTDALQGRKEEFRIFKSIMDGTGSRQSVLLLVQGGPGSGKSSLLFAFKEEAERAGLLAPFSKAERGEGAGDIIDKLFQDAALLSGAPAKASPKDYPELIRAIEGMAHKRHFGAILFLDDMDSMMKMEDQLALIMKNVGKSKVSFVVSATREPKIELLPSAKVMAIKPLDPHEAGEMVEKALKKGPPKMGEECMNSMMADTDGNPRLLRTVCRLVYERIRDNERVITKGHYLAYLPYIMSMLSREWFGRMYQETPPGERAILHALASSEDGMHVSDVARKIGKPMGPTTALMKRLLDSGQVVKIDRGKYRVFARLYAKYVGQRG
jgi:hypothetical protein